MAKSWEEIGFPIMKVWSRGKPEPQPLTHVPWGLMLEHQERAVKNHDQTIQRLAERQGLDTFELCAILLDRSCFDKAMREQIDNVSWHWRIIQMKVKDYEERTKAKPRSE